MWKAYDALFNNFYQNMLRYDRLSDVNNLQIKDYKLLSETLIEYSKNQKFLEYLMSNTLCLKLASMPDEQIYPILSKKSKKSTEPNQRAVMEKIFNKQELAKNEIIYYFNKILSDYDDSHDIKLKVKKFKEINKKIFETNLKVLEKFREKNYTAEQINKYWKFCGGNDSRDCKIKLQTYGWLFRYKLSISVVIPEKHKAV